MQTKTIQSIPYLDGWRGLAILLVLVSHFLLGAGGELGVALFFVLSGYLVSGMLFQRETGLGIFFWRRATRILPTFWLYLAVMAVYTAMLQPMPHTIPAGEMLATLTFLRTYLPPGESIWSAHWPIGHVWSLNVEEHAYLVLGLIAVLVRASGVKWLLRAALFGCVGASCVCIFYYSRTPPGAGSPWMLRSECAALGMLASAWIHTSRPLSTFSWIRNGHWSIAPLALLAGLLCYVPGAPYLAAPGLAPLLLALAVNYLDCAPPPLLRLLSLRFLRWCGMCSFSLYMWQQPFYKAIALYGLPRPAALAMALAVGTGAFYCFEKPLRQYLNRVWQERRMSVPA
ncbi:MAG: acyltransferase [Pseudomonadota bacterium]|nr:acyltransferase [Pseudomonadota bacterium]